MLGGDNFRTKFTCTNISLTTRNRATFNWVPKVLWDCICFASLRSVIGPEHLRHTFNQSGLWLKPITTWSPPFSRVFPRFGQFGCFYFEVSSTLIGICLCFNRPLRLHVYVIWFWFYDTQWKCTLTKSKRNCFTQSDNPNVEMKTSCITTFKQY